MINVRDKSIANCHLVSRQGDITNFSVDLEDYEQTEILHLDFSVVDTLFTGVKTSFADSNIIQLTFPRKSKSAGNQALTATFSNLKVTSLHDSLLYTFAGKMSSEGNVYDFYGQTDPWPFLSILTMTKLVQGLERLKNAFLDYCSSRYNVVQQDCPGKKLKYIKKPFKTPLFEIGSIPIAPDAATDCRVICP